jgi:cation-transporting ATPase E
MTSAVAGLTEREAEARRKRGDGNDTGGVPGRSYWDIVRANLFNLFNNILFAIGVALIALSRYNDAGTVK